jgi:hypothetical protein
MLKQLHQFTQTIDGKVFSFYADIDSQIPHMEQALLGILQFIGHVKRQQEAANQAKADAEEKSKVEPIQEESKPA